MRKDSKKVQLRFFPVEKSFISLEAWNIVFNCPIFCSRSVIHELEPLGTMHKIRFLGELIFRYGKALETALYNRRHPRCN
jgi:hypothetical protein